MLNGILDLVEIFENIPEYIEYAVESIINLFFLAVEGLLIATNTLLGNMPEVIEPPGYLSEINWYYPVGSLMGIFTPFITLYLVWLGISWIYRKIGAM